MQLLETVKALNGVLFHLSYHQQRLDLSLMSLGIECSYSLETLLNPPAKGLTRCRILYNKNGINITYHPYVPKVFYTLQAVIDDTISYPFKYADRGALDTLYASRGECDDVIIIQNDLLCDTSIANLALFDGERWVTPAQPLLKGSTRQRLLDEGKIVEKDVVLEDLPHYHRYALMNAMLGFSEMKNGIILPPK